MLAGLIIVASALSFVFLMTAYWSPGHRIVAVAAIFGFGIGVVWLWDELRDNRIILCGSRKFHPTGFAW